MAKKPEDKNKENIDMFKEFLKKKQANIGDPTNPPEIVPTHPMDQLAKEGEKLLADDKTVIETPTVVKETVSPAPKIDKNPYNRAKSYVLSKMEDWNKNKFLKLCRDLESNVPISNDADQRLLDDTNWKITMLGDDLADGLPLPKK